MKLQIEEDGHRFFEPVFKQLAELVDKDYEIKHDSTGDALSLSFTVIHKKYKHHGLNISTYLNENPPWTIQGYYDLPVDIGGVSKYEFTPELDDENYPLLTDSQIATIKTKIKAINKRTIMDIKEIGKDIEDNQIGQKASTLESEYGIDLRGFKAYGIKVNYKGFLLSPSRTMAANFKRMEAVINSKDPEVQELIPDMINMNLDAASTLSENVAIRHIRRFNTKIFGLFTMSNEDSYITMVKEIYPFEKGYNSFDLDMDGYTADEFIHSPDNNRIKSELYDYFYTHTEDTHFISKEAQELFLF